MCGSFKNRDYAGSDPSVVDFGIRVAVVLIRGDEILLVRHEKPGREPYHVLPGGRLEPGETIPECAVREMSEETGLDVEFGGVLYVNEFLSGDRHTVDITVAVAQVNDKEATLGSDPEVAPGEAPTLSGIEWVSLEELTSAGLLPRQVAERVLSDAEGDSFAGSPGTVYLGAGRD